MQPHLFATIGLGVVGIALSGMPGTASAGTLKIHWCHWANHKYVLLNISVRGEGDNPGGNDLNPGPRGHEYHALDYPAVLNSQGEWTCEAEQPSKCVLGPTELLERKYLKDEFTQEWSWQWVSVSNIDPMTADWAVNYYYHYPYYQYGPVYKVLYSAVTLPEGDYEARASITNLTEVPLPLNSGPVSGISNDLGGGAFDDAFYGAEGFDDEGLSCGITYGDNGVPDGISCKGDVTGDTVVVQAITDEYVLIRAGLYVNGEVEPECASKIPVFIGAS
ncbi:MAG: hypothetical protein JRI25_12725 [Deltaproteobacteria bacterium]|nr:hypothetical protein [Deltaproteobacteria bacterium]